jgi:ankyrin repeat protein
MISHNIVLLEAAKYNKEETIIKLIKRGADVNTRDKFGCTPIFLAAVHGHLHVLRTLIQQGGDVNISEMQLDMTPVYVAASTGHLDVVRALAKHGADVNMASNEGFTPINIAAEKGHVNIVRELAEHGADVNNATNDGYTPICIAASTGHLDVVRALVEYGADVNMADNEGISPICCAAFYGHINTVKVLAAHGAEINGNTAQWSPVFGAATNNHFDIISLLYALGADMSLPLNPSMGDTSVKTLADAVRASGHEEAAVLIESILSQLAAKRCYHCGHTPMVRHALYRCSVCKTTLYCSRDCQEKDWKNHKSSCSHRECSLLHLLQR